MTSRVYIIDDNKDLCKSLEYLFDSVNITTETYHSARDFLNHYRNTPGCLLLDIRMPEMTGLALQNLLCQKNIRIPVIFMTGHGDVPMAVRAMKQGAFDFFTKPFDHQLLLEAVHRAIDQDQRWREKENYLRKIEQLTSQEKRIVEHIVKGISTAEIAKILHLSPKTVEYHRGKIMKKLNVQTPIHLASLYHSYQEHYKEQ